MFRSVGSRNRNCLKDLYCTKHLQNIAVGFGTADWHPEVMEIVLQWEAAKCAERAGPCHYEAVLSHHSEVVTIRGDSWWLEKGKCHTALWEGQERASKELQDSWTSLSMGQTLLKATSRHVKNKRVIWNSWHRFANGNSYVWSDWFLWGGVWLCGGLDSHGVLLFWGGCFGKPGRRVCCLFAFIFWGFRWIFFGRLQFFTLNLVMSLA